MRRVCPLILLILWLGFALTERSAFGQAAKPEAPKAADPKAQDPKPAAAESPKDDSFEAMPRRRDMPIPTMEELFKGPAYDWLVIKAGENDKVLVIQPVDLRPGALEFWTQRSKDAFKLFPNADKPEDRERRAAMKYARITLREEPEQEYKVDLQYIREVVYYEDLMLQRVDLLLEQKNVRDALQLLLAVEAREKNWPGSAARQKRLLWIEAEQLMEKQPDPALVRLEELFARDPAYTNLDHQVAVVADRLIADALSHSDYRQARHFIKRLQRMFPEHLTGKTRTAELVAKAREALSQAVAAEQAGQWEKALDLVEQAARIWPEIPDLATTNRRISSRYQRLRVGVWDQPTVHGQPREIDATGTPLREADRRCQALLELPLFRPSQLDKKAVRFAAPLLSGWEPTDLGHSLQLRLKTVHERWESRPTITAGDIALALTRRIDPESPEFDERIANYIESLSVRSPEEMTIRFKTVPLRPEALFGFPINPPPAEQGTSSVALTWPFHEVRRDERHVVYRRTVAEPEVPPDWHVSEIDEVRYDSADKAVQGLLRGEVQAVPRLPVWKLHDIDARSEFYTLPYDLPETHLLQFRPDGPAVASRTLRRALTYCLNRPQILQTVFLRNAPEQYGKLATGPVPSESAASNLQVTQHKFDPVLAFSLMPAVRKELDGKLPSLALRCPDDPDVQEAARKLTDAWKKLGLEVSIVPENSPQWDLTYRVVRLSEPLVDLWPTVTYPRGTDVDSLRLLAPWIREQFLELDQVGDFVNAELLMHRIHRQLWAEIQMIPLWELQQVLVVRKNIRGLSTRPFVTYDNVEQWKVDPWYPRD